MPPRVGGKEAFPGVPGSALCRIDPPARGALRTMPYRAPPGRAPLPGLFRLRGRPPASHRRGRSPSNSPPTRPRRWGDAGPPGRQRVTAGRKAGAEGVSEPGIPPSPTVPHSLGYAQPASTSLTGRRDARPHNARPTWCGSDTETEHAGNHVPSGCRAWLCARTNLAATRPAPHKVHAGLPRGARSRSALPATKQAAGVPSAWSQPFQSTHE